MGTVFRSETQPRSIDIVETMNDAQNYLWIDFSNYVPGDLQTLTQALQIHLARCSWPSHTGGIHAWMSLAIISL
jgi:hypothetical protein